MSLIDNIPSESAAVEYVLSDDGIWSDFIKSLRDFYNERGYLSPAQSAAALRFKDKYPPRKPKTSQNLGGDLKPIAEMFAVAKQHLRYPKIVLRVNDEDVQLYPAGIKSKYPGWIQIKSATNSEWYGRVNPETGELHASRRLPGIVRDALVEFAQKTFDAIKKQADLTDNCCFCRRELSDPRSMSQGYGPICASHFGLPWGEVNYSSTDES